MPLGEVAQLSSSHPGRPRRREPKEACPLPSEEGKLSPVHFLWAWTGGSGRSLVH